MTPAAFTEVAGLIGLTVCVVALAVLAIANHKGDQP